MPQNYQEQIDGDIRHAIGCGLAGQACDVAQWQKVLELPVRPNGSPIEAGEHR